VLLDPKGKQPGRRENDGKRITAEDITFSQIAANIAADKEISESIEPYQEYMLKDLDEEEGSLS
jgi:hypothetical protein